MLEVLVCCIPTDEKVCNKIVFFYMYSMKKWGSEGLPPEKFVEVMPYGMSENSLLQNRYYLLSLLIFMLGESFHLVSLKCEDLRQKQINLISCQYTGGERLSALVILQWLHGKDSGGMGRSKSLIGLFQ